jgi:hypothetical protein
MISLAQSARYLVLDTTTPHKVQEFILPSLDLDAWPEGIFINPFERGEIVS